MLQRRSSLHAEQVMCQELRYGGPWSFTAVLASFENDASRACFAVWLSCSKHGAALLLPLTRSFLFLQRHLRGA